MCQKWQERHAEPDCVSVSEYYNIICLILLHLSAGARHHSYLQTTYICRPDARQRRFYTQLRFYVSFVSVFDSGRLDTQKISNNQLLHQGLGDKYHFCIEKSFYSFRDPHQTIRDIFNWLRDPHQFIRYILYSLRDPHQFIIYI